MPAAPAPAAPPHWTRALRQRFLHLFWLKTLGIIGFLWLFFVAYFQLLRAPSGPAQVMPLTALDHAIAFQPNALWAYVSLWVYVGIPPGIQPNLRALLAYGAWIAALCLTGLGIFWLWPTAVPPPTHVVDLVAHPGFAVLHGVDAAGNACPSLHVATAVFSLVWLHRQLQAMHAPAALQVLNGVWCALIVYSTLAIKQHVVWDAVAGLALGLLFALASLRRHPAGGV